MPTLNWIGKDAVSGHHQQVPFRLLSGDDAHSVGDDGGNLLVEGDNLEALKALLPHYAGEVKCVYIDPPYNTGNEGWSYNDNVDSPQIRRWLHETVGGEAEDLSRHDKWLSMMQPRLMLLHELLAENGSLWMSIDDNEVHHARALLDSIFGRQNFVANVVWQKRTSPDSRKNLGAAHDHILVYARDHDELELNLIPLGGKRADAYTNPDNDPRGRWASVDMTGQTGHATDEQFYDIETPSGKVYGPPPERCWALAKSTFEKLVEDNRVWFGEDGSNRPRKKLFLAEAEGMTTWTWWTHNEVGHNQEAKKELNEVVGESGLFNTTPKPTRLIQRILEIATNPGDLVLDSFAGTGTTGHAVMKQNAQDSSDDSPDRRFILVEMESDIARDVTAERLRRAAEGYAYTGNDYDVLFDEKLGVRTFQNAEDVLRQMENLKKEHADEYDGFQRRVKDGKIMLRGKKEIEGRKEGLGGGFRYCTLGPVLMGAGGQIQRDVSYEALARHVHYSATGRPLPANGETPEPPLIHAGGENGSAAYYLLYNGVLGDARPDGGNVLTRHVLDGLPAPPNGASSRVVFGTACRLSERELAARNVRFRQIPYDVRTS